MDTTRHIIAVTVRDDRVTAEDQQAAGHLTVHGHAYGMSDEDALTLALDSGHIDLASAGGRFVRAWGTLVPADHVLGITATVVSASRPNTPEEQAAIDAQKAAGTLGKQA